MRVCGGEGGVYFLFFLIDCCSLMGLCRHVFYGREIRIELKCTAGKGMIDGREIPHALSLMLDRYLKHY